MKGNMKGNIKTPIKERLKKDLKVRTSLIISKSVLDRLNKFKESNKIKTLSPLIEIMITDWLNDIEEDKDYKKTMEDKS